MSDRSHCLFISIFTYLLQLKTPLVHQHVGVGRNRVREGERDGLREGVKKGKTERSGEEENVSEIKTFETTAKVGEKADKQWRSAIKRRD